MSKRKASKPAISGRRASKAAPQAAVEAPVQVNAPADNATYLQGNFDIHGIENSYREFRGLLASGLPVVIDVGGLKAVDTCGVQLLLAVEREAQRRAVPLTLRGESVVFDSALHRLGLSNAFASVRRHG